MTIAAKALPVLLGHLVVFLHKRVHFLRQFAKRILGLLVVDVDLTGKGVSVACHDRIRFATKLYRKPYLVVTKKTGVVSIRPKSDRTAFPSQP